MDDCRYSEFLFLESLTGVDSLMFNANDEERRKSVGLSPALYVDMVATLIEDMYVRFKSDETQMVVSHLRRELHPEFHPPGGIQFHEWENPRSLLRSILNGHRSLEEIRITYRGLRRIEELREFLRRDRILDHMGILLSIQYFLGDLKDALRRGSEIAVSVIYCDMDSFKPINDKFGHDAGDVVMRAYLESARDTVGQLGTAYRGAGDEVAVLIVGQGHDRAVKIAEKILESVSALRCTHKGASLPSVTASVGVASAPPDPRTADIESLAEGRMRNAKQQGKNRVISA